MASTKVPSPRDAGQVAALLWLPEIMRLISDLDETRWTGRPVVRPRPAVKSQG